MQTFLKIISATDTAERITTTGGVHQFNSAVFFGYNNFNNGKPVNNTSGVYLGIKTTEQPIFINSGGANFSWNLQHKSRQDLSNWYIQGNAGDGVYIITEN